MRRGRSVRHGDAYYEGQLARMREAGATPDDIADFVRLHDQIKDIWTSTTGESGMTTPDWTQMEFWREQAVREGILLARAEYERDHYRQHIGWTIEALRRGAVDEYPAVLARLERAVDEIDKTTFLSAGCTCVDTPDQHDCPHE